MNKLFYMIATPHRKRPDQLPMGNDLQPASLARVRFGRTDLQVTRLALCTQPFGTADKSRDWNPFSPEGRATAIRVVHAALDAGINCIDTSPTYGDGNSELIVGQAIQSRRDQLILATKLPIAALSPPDVRSSVESSLRRLQTDHIDIIQFHARAYADADIRHILHDGLLDTLESLRDQGRVRFIGFSFDEPLNVRPLIASFHFDMLQVRYNLIHQSAGQVLNEARETGLGVVASDPAPALFQHLCHHLAPHWQGIHDPADVAVKFVLSDSRVHTAAVRILTPEHAAHLAALASLFQPPLDIAALSDDKSVAGA